MIQVGFNNSNISRLKESITKENGEAFLKAKNSVKIEFIYVAFKRLEISYNDFWAGNTTY